MEIARVGVLGGTFNPIHLGHLHIAKSVQQLFSLSQVYFVVATRPPHKLHEDLIPFVHRYSMVCLAVAGDPSFIPSMIELEPQASPFSVDTMGKLSSHLNQPEESLFFIAGGDSLTEVNSWRESGRLLTTYNFVFAVRPGVHRIDFKSVLPEQAVERVCDLSGVDFAQVQRRLAEKAGNENGIYVVDVGAPHISATKIRERISSGKAIGNLVPDTVREYIHKLHLYGAR